MLTIDRINTIVVLFCWFSCRSCLDLISVPHPVIAEEYDLIESLRLLSGFGVSIFPVQGNSYTWIFIRQKWQQH